MADAEKAEFSRNNGNPLYLPDHTPIQLPTHILEGDLDLKPSLKCSHQVAVSQSPSSANNMVGQEEEMSRQLAHSTQTPNGNCNCHAVTAGDMETQEYEIRSLEIQEYGDGSTANAGIAVVAEQERNCPS